MMKHVQGKSHWSHRVYPAIVALALVGGLSSCSSARGGQTAGAAASEVKSLPGISKSTDVYSNSSYSGFTKKNATLVVVTVDPDHRSEDTEELVEFLIRVAWSVNDAKPNMELMVTVKSTVPIDALAAARAAGWTSAHSLNNERSTVFVGLSEAKKRLGDWPGKVPETDGLLGTVTTSP